MASAFPALAVASGVAAAAAYLDGKYQIRRDLNALRQAKKAEDQMKVRAKSDRCCLWYDFEDVVKRMPPEHEAIWSRTGCYTWQQTYDQACRYGAFLQSVGVKPRDLVATALKNSPEFLFNLLGVWSIGCAPAQINHHLAGEALVHCIKISGAKVVVVDGDPDILQRVNEVRPALEGELGVRIVVYDAATMAAISSLPAKTPDDSLRRNMSFDYPMSLCYTSGSTGFPKAIHISVGRASRMAGGGSSSNLIPGPNGDRYYVCMPFYHATALMVLISCLMTGVTFGVGEKFSASRFWDDVRDSRATAFVYVGETARYLLAAPPSPRDKDHQVKSMFGNGLRPEVWKRFRERFGIATIIEVFASTEGVLALVNVNTGPFTDACVGQHGGLARWLFRNLYVAAKIDHDTGDLWRDPETGFGKRNSLAEGGEIVVAAPRQAFAGYWNNPEATEKKFAKDLFKKGDLWYRSGDALRRDDEGRWYFMDRLGDTFRWKAENVATADVSESLGYHPGLIEAIVYGVQVPGYDGRAGCAAISLNIGQAADAAFFKDLLRHATEKLPKYAVPVFIRLQAELKPMHNQKQNKPPLKKDGIDLDMIYGPGKDFQDAKLDGKDVMYWWPSAVGLASAAGGDQTYVPFERKDWEALKGNAKEVARL